MRSNTLRGLAIGLIVVTTTGRPLVAQSLADLAKQEEERRKAVKQPAKVITNKDLGAVPPASGAPAPAPPPGPTASTPSAPPAVKPADAGKDADAKDKKEAGEPAKDQAYWSGRLKTLLAQLDRDQTYADALQSRINALTTDFVNRADPAQRAVIERDRQKAIAELNRLTGGIEKDKKAIADFEEEARRAAVPPGWLR